MRLLRWDVKRSSAASSSLIAPPPKRARDVARFENHCETKPLCSFLFFLMTRRGNFYIIIIRRLFVRITNYRVLSPPVGPRRKPWTMLPLYAEWTGWAVTTRNMALLLLGCCSAVRSRKSRKDKVRWNGRYKFDLASVECPFGTLHLVNLRRPQNRLALLPLIPKTGGV